ncbi:MAG TPA: magnesium transporter [Acidimicrobiales bacterium]|nr:magnesium transporter [Acidimicrobiales bacterium]
MRSNLAAAARLRALLGPDAAGVRQSLVALGLNSSTSLVAGAFLGAITGTFQRYPGLLVLVPAAIGLRGNIFGSFGNRISTSIHSGTFRWSLRREAVLGQNVLASMVLTMGISLALAVVAKAVAVGLGVSGSIDLLSMATVSIVGGLLGSVVVLGASLGLTAGAVRFGWDLDNVTAPLVSTLGDVLTLPALYLATGLLGISVVTPSVGVLLVAASLVFLVAGWRTSTEGLRRIVRESVPVLLVAGCVSAGAGLTLEKSFARFDALPALLVLVPAHLSSSGALGGILSGRLSSKLFLGLVPPDSRPNREARRDITLALLLAVPVYLFNGLAANAVATALGQASPGALEMAAVSLIAGGLAILFVATVAYYGTVVAYRTGVDPDTYGIPIVSSSVDFVGAFTLIIAISLLGLS